MQSIPLHVNQKPFVSYYMISWSTNVTRVLIAYWAVHPNVCTLYISLPFAKNTQNLSFFKDFSANQCQERQSTSVLAIHCCISNYPKTSWPKTPKHHYFIVSIGSGSLPLGHNQGVTCYLQKFQGPTGKSAPKWSHTATCISSLATVQSHQSWPVGHLCRPVQKMAADFSQGRQESKRGQAR